MNFIEEIKNFASKRPTMISVIFIVILGSVVYCNSLNYKFIWDDYHLIKNNIFIKNWSHFPKIFTSDIVSGAARKSGFYRPIQMLTYMMDYSIWRLNERGYHITNVLLHVFAALIVYWLIYMLCRDRITAVLSGALFLVHPIHTEAVTYISGRADSLAAIFILLTFILYIKQLKLQDIRLYSLMILSYIAALLSKENSLILPALIMVYHYAFKEKIKFKALFPILAAALIYILLRATFFRGFMPDSPHHTNFFERLPGFFVAITDYLKLLFLPFDLHMEYGVVLFNFLYPKAIMGIAILVLSISYALTARNKNKLIAFSTFWFFTALLPHSNIYPINAYMAEHWLYLPSIGFFLILAQGLSILCKRRRLSILSAAAAISLFIFYSSLTIRQNDYWKEPIAFFERTLKFAPGSPAVLVNLGKAYREEKGGKVKKENAISLYEKAIKINPYYALAYNNLGSAYRDIGKTEEAISAFKKAIELNPESAEAYSNLGGIYGSIGKTEEAISMLKKAIELEPSLTDAYGNLGATYLSIGKTEEAVSILKKTVEIDSNFVEAYSNLGVAYNFMGKFEEAVSILKKAIEMNPDFADAYNNLGLAYEAMGMKPEAASSYKKAIEIKPDFAKAYRNLAIICYKENRYEEAVKYYDKATELGYEIDPEFLKVLDPFRQ